MRFNYSGILTAALSICLLTGFFATPLPLLAVCSCYDDTGNASSIDSEAECSSACVELGETLSGTGDNGFCQCTSKAVSIDCNTTCTGSALSNTDPTASSSGSSNASKTITPSLNVDIPGLDANDFSITKNGDALQANFYEAYISAIYVYLIGASVTFAIVMIMIGGLQYAFAGGHGETAKAKTRIKNAVIGFVLLLSVYMILYLVNPQLVSLQAPALENIQYAALIDDSGDSGGGVTTENLEDIGIECPPGDGDVGNLASSFINKVTYRFGAKGGDPPYDDETRTDDAGTAFSTYCPEDTICSDCSGFVGIVAECAGLSSVGESGGTAGIFASADSITSCSGGSVTTASGTISLSEGDLVGFKDGDREGSSGGHVWMYIGDGNVISAMGGTSGRQPGGSVKVQTLEGICKSYPLRVRER